MKKTMLTGLSLCILLLSGCALQMSADERVNQIYGTQESVESQNIIIHEPEAGQCSNLTIEYDIYTLETQGYAFYGMSPDEVQAKKASDGSGLYTQYIFTALERTCGISTSSDETQIHFNRIEYANRFANVFDNLQMISKNYANYKNLIDNSDVKMYFPNEELDDFSLDEATSLCNATMEKLGIPVGYYTSYAMDAASINNLQKAFAEEFNIEMAPPGVNTYAAGELGELRPWTQNFYLFLYRQAYNKIPVEECLLYVFCDKENGVFRVTTMYPQLSDRVISEEPLTIINGEEAVKMAVPVLLEKGIHSEQIDELSVVYHTSAKSRNTEAATIALVPAWKVTYHQTINGVEVSDSILLDAVTGQPY